MTTITVVFVFSIMGTVIHHAFLKNIFMSAMLENLRGKNVISPILKKKPSPRHVIC
jgi:hypothetical protein